MQINPWIVNSETFLRKSFENGFSTVITDEVEKAYQIRKEYV